jgi:hypothetical protein
MSFIRTVPPQEASGKLLEIYEDYEKRDGFVPNFAQAFSLRPEAYAAYRALSSAIRARMPLRRFELATMASAAAMHCTY